MENETSYHYVNAYKNWKKKYTRNFHKKREKSEFTIAKKIAVFYVTPHHTTPYIHEPKNRKNKAFLN